MSKSPIKSPGKSPAPAPPKKGSVMSGSADFGNNDMDDIADDVDLQESIDAESADEKDMLASKTNQ